MMKNAAALLMCLLLFCLPVAAPAQGGAAHNGTGIETVSVSANTAEISGWTLLALPDTGQTGSYTPTFGEDSDYATNPPSYADNGDGTITDSVTGLTWQKTDGGEMTWENATSYSASLELGGHDDWRLPDCYESYSLLNHGRLNPAMDTAYFPSTGAGYWWTSQTRADDPARVWVTNSGGGIGPHPKSETISAGGTKSFHARCVRGGSPVSYAFADNGDGTVTDCRTGLMWQKAEGGSMGWDGALNYSEAQTIAGHLDWRLPNIKELQSLNDASRTNPSIDTTFFPSATASNYWSSTTLFGDTKRAWEMNFAFGIASYSDKAAACNVRCVRGPLAAGNVTAPGAMPVRLCGGFTFGEGAAADSSGNVFFSDFSQSIIYKWSQEGNLSVYRTGTNRSNGLFFDSTGNMVVCEGDTGRLVSIDAGSHLSVLADSYSGTRFNEPNDLWIAPNGGIYFTDPAYNAPLVQDGMHVYYMTPDRTSVTRVISDMVKPNGLIGTHDGKLLYVSDWGAAKVYRYDINPDGSLAGKALFASVAADGMEIDNESNIYMAADSVLVYSPAGAKIDEIVLPEQPTNMCFFGPQKEKLFITTRVAVYSVDMRVRGVDHFAPGVPELWPSAQVILIAIAAVSCSLAWRKTRKQ